MISGAHIIIYTKNAEADRVFFKDILGFKYVDAHDGWLIFALPPAEIAFHPFSENNKHEVYFICQDINQEVELLKSKGAICSEIHDESWGHLITVTLPGGGEIGIYQPKHKTAIKA